LTPKFKNYQPQKGTFDEEEDDGRRISEMQQDYKSYLEVKKSKTILVIGRRGP
jgi:hypothetical protein